MHNLPLFESHTFIEWVAFVYTFWCYFCFRPAAIILLTNVFLYSKLSNIRTFHKIYNSLICQSISIFLSKWLIFNNNYICRIASSFQNKPIHLVMFAVWSVSDRCMVYMIVIREKRFTVYTEIISVFLGPFGSRYVAAASDT